MTRFVAPGFVAVACLAVVLICGTGSRFAVAQSGGPDVFQGLVRFEEGPRGPAVPLPDRKPRATPVTLPLHAPEKAEGSRTAGAGEDREGMPGDAGMPTGVEKAAEPAAAAAESGEDPERSSQGSENRTATGKDTASGTTGALAGPQATAASASVKEAGDGDVLSDGMLETREHVRSQPEDDDIEAEAEAEIARLAEDIAGTEPSDVVSGAAVEPGSEPEERAIPETISIEAGTGVIAAKGRTETLVRAPVEAGTGAMAGRASGSATIPLPVRKPSKAGRIRAARAVEKDSRKVPGRTRPKLPEAGKPKTRAQQCAALTLCRKAFSNCRFSRKREETDENGWEVHKKKCSADYQKCIAAHFREGEMFFTRWFLPFDPCS